MHRPWKIRKIQKQAVEYNHKQTAQWNLKKPSGEKGEKDEQKNTQDRKQWGETVKEKKRRTDGLASRVRNWHFYCSISQTQTQTLFKSMWAKIHTIDLTMSVKVSKEKSGNKDCLPQSKNTWAEIHTIDPTMSLKVSKEKVQTKIAYCSQKSKVQSFVL